MDLLFTGYIDLQSADNGMEFATGINISDCNVHALCNRIHKKVNILTGLSTVKIVILV